MFDAQENSLLERATNEFTTHLFQLIASNIMESDTGKYKLTVFQKSQSDIKMIYIIAPILHKIIVPIKYLGALIITELVQLGRKLYHFRHV